MARGEQDRAGEREREQIEGAEACNERREMRGGVGGGGFTRFGKWFTKFFSVNHFPFFC